MLLATVVALVGGYYWGAQYASGPPAYTALLVLPEPVAIRLNGLQDQEGEPFTGQRLQGRWSLLLLGYSHADDTTPALLVLATRILNRLADHPRLQEKLQVVLVSVDPERDSPAVLKRFLSQYHPGFIGITGPLDRLRSLASQLGARFRRNENTNSAGYDIAHSTSIALSDPAGRLAGLFTGRVDAASIAGDLKLIADTYHP